MDTCGANFSGEPGEEMYWVMVMETGNPTTRFDPTPKEVEHVRADLEKRRSRTRKLPTDIRP